MLLFVPEQEKKKKKDQMFTTLNIMNYGSKDC